MPSVAAQVPGSPTDVPTAVIRRTLFALILVGTLARLALAATSFGTNDVEYFRDFASAIDHVGPYGIYGVDASRLPYNHGPVTGSLLWAADAAADTGASFPLLLRLPMIVADIGTALLAYAIVRRSAGARRALQVAALVALNPVLIAVSGFHGNTDPMLVLAVLGSYVLLDRRRPLPAGAVLGAAFGVKIVAGLVAPVLLVAALRRGLAGRFALAAAVTGAVLWGPVILVHPAPFLRDVIGYGGVSGHAWGIGIVVQAFAGPSIGRERVVALAAAAVAVTLSAIVARRSAHDEPKALLLALLIPMTVAVTSSLQYLVWPVAIGVVFDRRRAIWFSLAASAYSLYTYTYWSGGLPWDAANAARQLDAAGLALSFLPWSVALGWALSIGRDARRSVTT